MLPPADLIDALLVEAGLAGHTWHAEPLGTSGHINVHALVSVSDEPSFVVRWYGWPWDEPSPIDRLEKELWLHSVLQDARIDVPRIYSHARTEHGDGVLMEYVSGDLLGDMDRSASRDSWRQAGRALRRTHQLAPPSNEAGRLKGGGVVPFEQGSWTSWNVFITRLHADAAARAHPGRRIDADACVRVVERATPLLDARPLRIIHGDANPWNVLVDGKGRTVWLDWEFAQAGDPVWDLMRMSAHHHRDIGGVPDEFFDGYGARPAEPAFSIYTLGHYLWMAHDPSSRAWKMACVDAADRYVAELPQHLQRIERLIDEATSTVS